MTGNELIDFMRYQLREKYAKEWTNDNLVAMLNDARKWVQMWITGYASEYFHTNCDITCSIGTQTYTLPNGVLYSAASKCNGTVDFIKQSNYEPVYGCDFRKIHDPQSGSIIDGFAIRHKTLWLDILPASAFTFTLYYYRVMEAIAENDTDIDFIPDCEELLAWIAIKNAKLRTDDNVSEINKRILEWQAVIRPHLGDRIEGAPWKANYDSFLTDEEYSGYLEY